MSIKSDHKPRRGKGCVVLLIVILLLVLLGVARIYQPRFATSIPTRIVIGAEQPGKEAYYKANVINQKDRKKLIDYFESGTWEFPCMCKGIARFEIHSENGAVEYLDLLPGHRGLQSLQIRRGFWHYGLSRKDLGRLLRDAGVDESKIFAYHDLLFTNIAATPED